MTRHGFATVWPRSVLLVKKTLKSMKNSKCILIIVYIKNGQGIILLLCN